MGANLTQPNWRVAAPVAVALVILLSVPFWMGPYPVGLMARILAFALLVVSIDLLTGYNGMPTLGQVAYFGAGAYAAGLIGIHLSTNAFVQLAAGTLVSVLLAMATGAVAIRAKGIVFLMVTLAIAEIAHQYAQASSFTGGSNGLSGIPAITILPGGESVHQIGFVYYWVLFVFLLGVALALVLVKSPLGRSMRGVRDSEARMEAIGQRSYPVKLMAYTFAGAIAGMAGAAWTAQARFISPGDVGLSMAALAFIAVILGGAGTLWGPIVAAIFVIVTRDYIGALVDGRGTLILGLVFIVAVFLLPKGIAGLRHSLSRYLALPATHRRKS